MCSKFSSLKQHFMKIRVQSDLNELEKNPMLHEDRIVREIVEIDIGREVGFINFTETPKIGYYKGQRLFVRLC
jgi:hypothetical protein